LHTRLYVLKLVKVGQYDVQYECRPRGGVEGAVSPARRQATFSSSARGDHFLGILSCRLYEVEAP
jgi:hypothetical protein